MELTSLAVYAVILASFKSAAVYRPREVPGNITTLGVNRDDVYEPKGLTRSLYTADGSNAFLLIDSSAIVIMSAPAAETENYTITQLVGHPVIASYVDGDALDARFSHIGDFVQTKDGRVVYIADRDNHCIRLFDREWNNVTEFAGKCTEHGMETGASDVARFSSPSSIVMSNTESELYIADRQNNRILKLNLLSEEHWVQTVVDNTSPMHSSVLMPTSMALNSQGDKLYITTENGLVRLTNFAGNGDPYKHTYRSGAMSMLDMALLHDDKYAVATDFTGNRLLFIDLINGGSAQKCIDSSTNHSRTSNPICDINTPHGVAVIDNKHLFITEYNSKLIKRVSYQLPNKGFTTTKSPSTSNSVPPTSEVTTRKASRRTHRHKSVTKRLTTSSYTDWQIEATTKEAAGKSSPLVLGLSAGILIPLVLVGALVSLVSYVKLQARRQANLMYARRTQQGGYDGPGFAENNFPSITRNRSTSITDQPPSYTPTHPYSPPAVHAAAHN